jgi:hypothetical protein
MKISHEVGATPSRLEVGATLEWAAIAVRSPASRAGMVGRGADGVDAMA